MGSCSQSGSCSSLGRFSALPEEPEQRELSLEDAVSIGIKNNLDVDVERHAPLIAREDLGIAWGTFDPEILLGGGISDFESPQASVLAGGNSAIDEKIYDGDAQIGRARALARRELRPQLQRRSSQYDLRRRHAVSGVSFGGESRGGSPAAQELDLERAVDRSQTRARRSWAKQTRNFAHA